MKNNCTSIILKTLFPIKKKKNTTQTADDRGLWTTWPCLAALHMLREDEEDKETRKFVLFWKKSWWTATEQAFSPCYIIIHHGDEWDRKSAQLCTVRERRGQVMRLMATVQPGPAAWERGLLDGVYLELHLTLVRKICLLPAWNQHQMQCSKTPHYNAPSSLTVRKRTSQWLDEGKCLCCSSHASMYSGFWGNLYSTSCVQQQQPKRRIV